MTAAAVQEALSAAEQSPQRHDVVAKHRDYNVDRERKYDFDWQNRLYLKKVHRRSHGAAD